ncbi:MAG: serine hydrolase [Acidobacteriia bacterium]|nr:serine hydrolase [Terriglobia bacterium]
MLRILRACVAVLACLPAWAQTSQEIDALAHSVLKDWQVPGLALAVVRDGSLVHEQGYGLRNVAAKLPVTKETLFGIGSISKSFTVLGLWSLQAEGKLDWDKPVRDQMAGFRLKDPVATDRATPRDLVTHRTGLPRHDAMWGGGSTVPPARQQIFQRLRYLEPSRDFRVEFQYNNLMFLTAGLLGEAVSGEKWEAMMQQRLFAPLGMRSSKALMSEAAKEVNYAQHYDRSKADWSLLPVENLAPSLDTIGPAGSIQSNLRDMARYLQAHIARGKLDGKPVLEERFISAMQTPQMVIASTATPGPYPGDLSYGMGLFLGHHRGRKAVWHTGTYGGHHALLWYLPEEQFGVMVLLNRVAREVPAILALTLADRFLGLPATDWGKVNREASDRARAALDKTRREFESTRRPAAKPGHALSEYSGSFQHAAYGTVEVALEAGALTLKRNQRIHTLTHRHYDVFTIGDGQDTVRFVTGINGEVEALLWKLEPALEAMVFRRYGD